MQQVDKNVIVKSCNSERMARFDESFNVPTQSTSKQLPTVTLLAHKNTASWLMNHIRLVLLEVAYGCQNGVAARKPVSPGCSQVNNAIVKSRGFRQALSIFLPEDNTG